jgi:hypothetical protein
MLSAAVLGPPPAAAVLAGAAAVVGQVSPAGLKAVCGCQQHLCLLLQALGRVLLL